MKFSEGRSRLFIPVLIAAILALVMVGVIIFMATRQPEILSMPQRLVQSVVVVPAAVTEAPKPQVSFGPFEMFGPARSKIKTAEKPKPAKQYDWSAPVRGAKGTGRVVVIIDDMGVDKRSAEVIAIKEPLTLAFLPYATNLQAQTLKAKANGHELMIHVPMQPHSNTVDPGPNVLTTSMSKEQVDAALEGAFNSFTGYVGINNHMGSAMTGDPVRMGWVMEALQKRGLFFVDSMTSAKSVGWKQAQEYGLAYGKRDVFLDDTTDMASVQASLRHLEALAYKNGVAIAIGHPKENTIAALKAWLPTLKDKGLTLVPVSQVVHRPQVKSVSAMPAPFGPHLPPHE